jgi:phosphohistidine phosphatase
MELLVLRHGIAGSREEWDGPDAERPLTDKGRSHSRDAARGLARMGVKPDVILTSPYLRAAETARLTGAALKAPVEEASELEPGNLLQGFLVLVQRHAEAASLMLVGHEPDLSALIGRLISGATPARVELKKGACAQLALDATAPTSAPRGKAPVATLQWLLTGRALRQIDAHPQRS